MEIVTIGPVVVVVLHILMVRIVEVMEVTVAVVADRLVVQMDQMAALV